MSGPGLLSVVATPIGNLEDISLRALRVLRAAALVVAEDTRRTAQLLTHHGIHATCQSFHAHNTSSRLPRLLERLSAGEHLALVTDAGTPGISDPGVELVHACHEASIRVEVVPGASAPLTAAVTSGFPLIPLTILGFPPTKSKERIEWFEAAGRIDHTLTFFEAPHRISSIARFVSKYFVDRQICAVREATKLYEDYTICMANDLYGRTLPSRGEYTIVVGPRPRALERPTPPSDARVADEFQRVSLASPHLGRRAMLDEVARALGLSRNGVYRALEQGKRLAADGGGKIEP
jgi:16S rRNA (cytidine1402-2'-O)-methyltransferase